MRTARKLIIPLDKFDGYFEATRLAAGHSRYRGKLPSNVLLDDYLIGTNQWKSIEKVLPVWGRGIVIHPEKGGKFRKGFDVVDSEEDKRGRKWILPASQIPHYAVDRENVALLVDPSLITEEKGNVMVCYGSIYLLHPFIQDTPSCISGIPGRVDRITRIPLETSKEVLEKLSDDEKRWFFRIPGPGVRPIVRGRIESDNLSGHYVYANYRHDEVLGVTAELSERDPAIEKNIPTQITVVRDGTKLIVSGTPEQLEAVFKLIEKFSDDS